MKPASPNAVLKVILAREIVFIFKTLILSIVLGALSYPAFYLYLEPPYYNDQEIAETEASIKKQLEEGATNIATYRTRYTEYDDNLSISLGTDGHQINEMIKREFLKDIKNKAILTFAAAFALICGFKYLRIIYNWVNKTSKLEIE